MGRFSSSFMSLSPRAERRKEQSRYQQMGQHFPSSPGQTFAPAPDHAPQGSGGAIKRASVFPSLVGACGPASTSSPHGLLGHSRVLRVGRLVNTQERSKFLSVYSLPGTIMWTYGLWRSHRLGSIHNAKETLFGNQVTITGRRPHEEGGTVMNPQATVSQKKKVCVSVPRDR